MFVDRLLVTSPGPVRCVLLSPLTEEENEVEKGARPRTQPHPGDSFFQEKTSWQLPQLQQPRNAGETAGSC